MGRRHAIRSHVWIRAYRQDAWCDQRGRCAYCRSPIPAAEATADHVIPQNAHGGDRRKNIVAACLDCNRAKGSMSKAQFMNALKKPEGQPLWIWSAWSRRRINLAVERFEKRVFRAIGVKR